MPRDTRSTSMRDQRPTSMDGESDSSEGVECSATLPTGDGVRIRACIGTRRVYFILLAIAGVLAVVIGTLDTASMESETVRQIFLWWKERKMKHDFAGRWCEGIAENPLWGAEEVAGICPNDHQVFFDLNISGPEVDENDTATQLQMIRDALDSPNATLDPNYNLYLEGVGALERLSQLKPVDIFAFRETWTDEDTNLLQELDNKPRAWVMKDKLTTTSFAQRLPSIADFADLVDRSPLAVVGGADSLTNASLGPEIDDHRTVARFNEIVGEKLSADETGLKTNLHVMCSKVPPLGDAGVAEIDLETLTPWRVYCGRMRKGGEHSTNPGKPFLIRPAAYCILQSYYYAKGWTRGFLFYWFVARLFKSYDMYGFRGGGHYKNDAPMLERYFLFEHFLYDILEPERH